MIFDKFNLRDSDKSSFLFNKEKHYYSWNHYSECYDYTLSKIINQAIYESYQLNKSSNCILFLLRQCFELTIKKNLKINNNEIPMLHNFNDLFNAFSDANNVPNDFKKIVDKINIDYDGSCYRYYSNKETDNITLLAIFEDYNNIASTENFQIKNICDAFDYNKKGRKFIEWDLTFHLNECSGIGQLRTQYDFITSRLVKGILNNNWDIHKIYIPLIFLVRHSIELALKLNIEKIREHSAELILKKPIHNEHSLSKLYNIFDSYLSKIKIDTLSESTKSSLLTYKSEYKSFNERLHQWDNNSQYFRFPFDNKGNNQDINIKKNDIYKLLVLYDELDTFLTFTCDVLEHELVSA